MCMSIPRTILECVMYFGTCAWYAWLQHLTVLVAVSNGVLPHVHGRYDLAVRERYDALRDKDTRRFSRKRSYATSGDGFFTRYF